MAPKMKNFEQVRYMFHLLGDKTRLEIMANLMVEEMNVSTLCDTMMMSKSRISHQLRLLKDNDLVRSTKSGRFVTYKISDQHVVNIIEQMIEHVNEENCEEC